LIDQATLKQHINDKQFARLYVICGGEAYLKQHFARQLSHAAVDETARDFNFHRFEGKDVSLNDLAQAVEAVPWGSERTCILVRDFALDSYDKDEDFAAWLADLPEHCVLIFWQDSVDFKPKKSKTLTAAINKSGHVAELNAPDSASVLKLVAAGVKSRGCTIDRQTADYFIQCVGGDLNLLQNELAKLCAFAAGEISRAHIDEVCVKSVDAKSFDMVKAVTAGNGTVALRLLDELFTQKIAPQLLLGSLVANYVDLYRAWAAMNSGKSAEAPAQLFDYKGKTFRLQNAGRMAQRMSYTQIRRSLDILDQADRRLKSSAMDNRLVMEQCVIGLLALRGNPS